MPHMRFSNIGVRDDTGAFAFECEFWITEADFSAGKPSQHRESFTLGNRPSTRQVPVRDAQGRVNIKGTATWIPEGDWDTEEVERETEIFDPVEKMREVVGRYHQKWVASQPTDKPFPEDHRDQTAIKRHNAATSHPMMTDGMKSSEGQDYPDIGGR